MSQALCLRSQKSIGLFAKQIVWCAEPLIPNCLGVGEIGHDQKVFKDFKGRSKEILVYEMPLSYSVGNSQARILIGTAGNMRHHRKATGK
jgi:hypothetical protein